MQGEQKVRKTV